MCAQKWKRFAKEKGIEKRTKRHRVWDEASKSFVLRWRKPRSDDIVEGGEPPAPDLEEETKVIKACMRTNTDTNMRTNKCDRGFGQRLH